MRSGHSKANLWLGIGVLTDLLTMMVSIRPIKKLSNAQTGWGGLFKSRSNTEDCRRGGRARGESVGKQTAFVPRPLAPWRIPIRGERAANRVLVFWTTSFRRPPAPTLRLWKSPDLMGQVSEPRPGDRPRNTAPPAIGGTFPPAARPFPAHHLPRTTPAHTNVSPPPSLAHPTPL